MSEAGQSPYVGIFDHKWLDPECVGNGCKSLLLLQRAERAEELADKYKWQVRDTCARAEEAERALEEADARVEAMREQAEATAAWKLKQWAAEGHPVDDRMIEAVKFTIRSLPAKGSPT